MTASLTCWKRSRRSATDLASLFIAHVAQMPASPGWIPRASAVSFRGIDHCFLPCESYLARPTAGRGSISSQGQPPEGFWRLHEKETDLCPLVARVVPRLRVHFPLLRRVLHDAIQVWGKCRCAGVACEGCGGRGEEWLNFIALVCFWLLAWSFCALAGLPLRSLADALDLCVTVYPTSYE